MTAPLHYMERLARDLKDAYLKEILDDFSRGLEGREPKASRTASRNPSTTTKTRASRGPLPSEAASRPSKPRDCHTGIRAVRYVENTADLLAHPESFRCPECGMLLDSPKTQPALAATPRGRQQGPEGDQV